MGRPADDGSASQDQKPEQKWKSLKTRSTKEISAEVASSGRKSQVPSFASTVGVEGGRNPLAAQAAQNPIVWLGLGATVTALGMGLKAMMSGDRRKSQQMMRARVGAQFFTVASLVGTLFYLSFTEEKQTAKWEKGGGVNVPQLEPLPPLPVARKA